jgi:hypothetical protein
MQPGKFFHTWIGARTVSCSFKVLTFVRLAAGVALVVYQVM